MIRYQLTHTLQKRRISGADAASYRQVKNAALKSPADFASVGLSRLNNEMNNMINSQKIKYAFCAAGSAALGLIFALYTRKIVFVAAGLVVAGYFIMEYLRAVQRAKDGKYVAVKALAVSADQQRDMTGIKETWRFVPVDEEGNPLRDTASHDIFLTVKQKDRNYHIGGTYNMLFCLEDDKGMNSETLVSIEQCFPASSTAKKAQEPVQEQPAAQEVGASVKKVNFQNVSNKPKLIVLDNRNRKQDGDSE